MSFNQNKKLITLFSIIFIISIVFTFIFFIFANKNENQKFNRSLCQNGHINRWVNACICENPMSYSGRYCTEKALKSCQSNTDCPEQYYCLRQGEQGSCYKASARGISNSKNYHFALSDSVMSYYNVEEFCSALGRKYRPVNRLDFDCNSFGVSCLNKQTVLDIQEKFGTIGFFWLDEKPDSEDAYYADMNDGIVYHMKKDNLKVAQALCIFEKN